MFKNSFKYKQFLKICNINTKIINSRWTELMTWKTNDSLLRQKRERNL